jgi:rubrerythrin
VARGRARRGALRAARHPVSDHIELSEAIDRAIAEEERMERWLEYVSRRVEAPWVKSFLHRMALEDRDHGRILRRHRNDLEVLPPPAGNGRRPPLPTHIEIRGEMGYYRALLTAVQMKAEAAEYYRKLAPAAENRYLRTFLQILANREEEQRDLLADLLDAQRGVGFERTKSGKIIPPTPEWLGLYLLDDPDEA